MAPPVQLDANLNMDAMVRAIAELKALAGKDPGDKDAKKKKKGKDSKKKKESKKKKKKSKKDSSSDSDDSSSSSSSSSSSNGPLTWKFKGKSREVTYAQLHAIDKEKFKKKGDLVAYAALHPGALTASFLGGVFARLSKGKMSKSSQLTQASVMSWVNQFSGLSEIRDVREAMTLAEIMDSVNRQEISHAMDVLCQRLLAIQRAREKGSSWDKAMALELIPHGASLATGSMLQLTNN